MPYSDKPSKSALKREQKATQAFVRDLVDAPDGHLARLPLSPEIIAEIRRARGLKMGARKRQIGFISKRMADQPLDAARAALQKLRQPAADASRVFHHIERLRESLIEGEASAFDELVVRYGADRGRLDALVTAARAERDRGATPKSARRLFRLIRERIGSVTVDGDAVD